MRLTEVRSASLEGLPDNVVLLLPVGSVEQHSHHMPLGTDTLIASAVAAGVERRLPDQVLLAPPLWYGASMHHLRFPGSFSIGTELLYQVITEVLSSFFVSTGVRHQLVLNGHGGNDTGAKVALETTRRRHPELRPVALNYWTGMLHHMAAAGEPVPPLGLGHACDVETSLLLAVAPELVDLTRLVSDPVQRTLPPYATTTADFFADTDHGGMGDPTGASREWGEALLEHAVQAAVDVVEAMGK